jgi:hypothetical protein
MGGERVKTSEVLIGAKELLETRDWCQGSYDGQGEDDLGELSKDAKQLCLEGALHLAANYDHALRSRALFYLVYEIKVDGGAGSIPLWNDAPMRHKGEVLDALDHAIKRAKDDESLRVGVQI